MFLVFFDFFSNIICMRENKVVILLDVEYVRMLGKKRSLHSADMPMALCAMTCWLGNDTPNLVDDGQHI